MTAPAGPLAAAGCLLVLASALRVRAEEGPRRPETVRYIAGFADSYRLSAMDGTARPFCIPVEYSAGQLTDIGCLALQRCTEMRHRPAAFTVLKAFKEEFSCK